MSHETNINFKCDACGHDEVVSLERGVTVASQVTQVVGWPEDSTLVISGHSRSGGEFAGYACGGCFRVVAADAAKLAEYLRSRGMLGEWRDM